MTIQKFQALKGKEKITMLTAYDAPTASILYNSGIDALLVGDSLGTVVYGHKNTLEVTIEDIIRHTRAVRQGAPEALIIADMPFLTYGISIPDSVYHAGRLIQEGQADAVKLEGGEQFAGHIQAMVEIGIPVMGHIGLQPQSVLRKGYAVAGRTKKEIQSLLSAAKALETAGVFAIVLEGTTVEGARQITLELKIPTIGIGAGIHTDGQVLVTPDMLGMDKKSSYRHSKKFVDLNDIISQAVKRYIDEVKKAEFPTEFNSFHQNQK